MTAQNTDQCTYESESLGNTVDSNASDAESGGKIISPSPNLQNVGHLGPLQAQ
jgi:hypothetical protein